MFCGCWAADLASFGASVPGRVGGGGSSVGSSGSACVGRPHCWKSHATAHLLSHPLVHVCLRNFRSQDYLIELSLAFIFRLFRF